MAFRRAAITTSASVGALLFGRDLARAQEETPRPIYALWLVPKAGSPFEVTANATLQTMHAQAEDALAVRLETMHVDERESGRLLPPLPDGLEQAPVVATSQAFAAPAPFPAHVQIGKMFLATPDGAVACGRKVASVLDPLKIGLSTHKQHAATQVHVYDEPAFNGVGVEVVPTSELRKASALANVMIDADEGADTGLMPGRVEDALEFTHAYYRPHISFLFGHNAEYERDELESVAKHVRAALVKHKALADGFVAHDLALVEHGQTFGCWSEVARFPLRW